MQFRREAQVFEAVSSSTTFPDAVSNIIADYVVTKEADELLQCVRLQVNLKSRIHFIHSFLAVWQNDKNRLEQMVIDADHIYNTYRFDWVMKPWFMVHYRYYIADIQEQINDVAEQEKRLCSYWGLRIPLEFTIAESDM